MLLQNWHSDIRTKIFYLFRNANIGKIDKGVRLKRIKFHITQNVDNNGEWNLTLFIFHNMKKFVNEFFCGATSIWEIKLVMS